MLVAFVLVFDVVLMVLFGCRHSRILVAVVVAVAVVLVVLLYDVLAPD